MKWTRQRGWFVAALAAFAVWVGVLATMAVVSSDRPRPAVQERAE
jgi:hypothetical protein